MIYAQPLQTFPAMLVGAPEGLTGGALTFRIIDPASGDQQGPLRTDMTETYPGVYYLQATAPPAEGLYIVLWETGDDEASEELEVSSQVRAGPSWPFYPDTDALVAASTVTELTELSADQQDALRASAITAIEEFCGQSFEPFDGVLEVEMPSGDEVWLPRRARSLVSVTPPGADPLDLSALVLTHDGQRLVWRTNYVGVGYYSQALYEVSGGDYPSCFRRGVYAVDAHWGWAPVPAPVIQAIGYDMEDQARADANALSSTVHVFRKLGLTNVSQGNLRADLGAVASLSPRVTRLLEPYVFLGQGGRLV